MYQSQYLTDNGIKKYLRTIDHENYIRHKMERDRNKPDHMDRIIAIVFEYFDLPVEMATVKDRKGYIIKARHLAMYFCRREVIGASLEWIGEHFNLSHATVIHAVRKIEGYLEYDKSYQSCVEHLDKQIRELYN